MCYRHVRAIFETDIRPPTAKLIALCIAEHADESGQTWVSQRVIAEETGCPIRTVQHHMKALRAAGVIGKKDGRNLRINPQPVAPFQDDETRNPLRKTRNQLRPSTKLKPATHCAETRNQLRLSPPPKENIKTPSPIREPSEPSVEKRARRLPDDWRADEDDRGYARDRGFSESQIDDMEANFAEHWHNKSGKAATKKNWNRAWQTWVRNQAEWNPPKAKRTFGKRSIGYASLPSEEL